MTVQHDNVDEETARPSLTALDGFPSFSQFIASDPDYSTLVFKRFHKLAMRNLLYLQSELAELQARQEQYDAEDQSIEHGDLQTKECAMNWEKFRDASRQLGNEKQKKRMELVSDIRAKMKEYSKNLAPNTRMQQLTPCFPRRRFAARKLASCSSNTSSSDIRRCQSCVCSTEQRREAMGSYPRWLQC